MLNEEFSLETKDSKKALYGFKCNRNTKKSKLILACMEQKYNKKYGAL